MTENSPNIVLNKFIDLLSQMQPFEQEIYAKMVRCYQTQADLCEMVYQINTCFKKNDNAHYYLVYDNKWF